MDSFGAYLKAHREKKGIRLEEIASITKIHLHSLELLETNRFEQLPPEPFIRGFIIAYAKYVGLATNEVLERYREATGLAATPAAEAVAQENTRSANTAAPVVSTPSEIITKVRLPSGPKMITAASLIAVVGLAALLINVGKEADAPPAIPTQVTMTPETVPADKAVATAPKADPKPEEDRKVAAGAETPKEANKPAPIAEAPVVAPTDAPTAAAPTLNGPVAHEVVVEGKERTWLKVVIDENPPTEYFLGEGKSATYKAATKIKVVLGNSTGSRVLYNGKEVDGKQFMGTIKSYKFPPDARFPQDVPSKRTPTTNADGENAAATPAAAQ